jgi:[ribosomal protein S5]-alanine N-acetyltransferase
LAEQTFIETPRLLVRTWRESDLAEFHEVMSDPLVHRFTAEQPYTEAQTREMIDWCIAHHLGEAPGYFNCPLVLRESGRVIGRVGLNPFREYRAGETVPEIEWTLGSAYWGQGYATEIGREMLRYGLGECGFAEIVGFAEPEHTASCRVMAKIGMRPLGLREARGRSWSFYVASRP